MAATPRNERVVPNDETITPANTVPLPIEANPIRAGSTDKDAQETRLSVMREVFAKQKKVSIRIRPELGDQTPQVNGYTFWIKAGERVEVPEQIAEMLQDANII